MEGRVEATHCVRIAPVGTVVSADWTDVLPSAAMAADDHDVLARRRNGAVVTQVAARTFEFEYAFA